MSVSNIWEKEYINFVFKVATHISSDPHYESQGVDAEELAQRMTQLHATVSNSRLISL